MSAPLEADPRVGRGELTGIGLCLVLALIAEARSLPIWVTVTVAVAAAIRLARAAQGADAPPRALRLTLSFVAVGLLFLQFHTFNGLSAGGALLTLMAGLKLLETRTRRDVRVVAMCIYFICLALLLDSESFWLFGYLAGVAWLTTAAQLYRPTAANAGPRDGLRRSARLLAQALPIALAFWLFFPRFGGPLWQLPDESRGATTGLSDSMSPGDITDLALSDEVAFRVRFMTPPPPPESRYWRGPVLHEFDGRTWKRTESPPGRPPPLQVSGAAYRYVVSLEPDQRDWIFTLDWPVQWDLAGATLSSDHMLVPRGAVPRPLDVSATSYVHANSAEPLGVPTRNRDTHLPPGRNARTLEFARRLRAAHTDDLDYVHAVLDVFRNETFYYTLTPPRLADDSVDAFLFDTRRGFCGHYASAFATLMRAAKIPARVVTGYHGGTYNRFADYWIVRQSDAHAWVEVWIAGHGWLRVDPTSMIAPERVERGLNELVSAGQIVTSRWQQRTPWFADARLRLDALRLLWRERILRFDEGSQARLLEWLHVPEPDAQKLVLILAVCLAAGMGGLTWQVRRDLGPKPPDRIGRAFAILCRRLAAAGVERAPWEGAEAFATRVALRRPDLADAVAHLCRRYSDLRYGRAADPAGAAAFVAAVRAFRPRGSRVSSRT